jgi:hypothetical protein
MIDMLASWIDRAAAQRAGYYIREGAFLGSTDDCIGRWYIGHQDSTLAPYGEGYPTQRVAWSRAAEMARARQG